MPDSTLALRRLLSYAILNDNQGGVVSEADARAMVDAALAALETAEDPEGLHEQQARFIAAAQQLVGGDRDAVTLLAGYTRRAERVIARLADEEADVDEEAEVDEEADADEGSESGSEAGLPAAIWSAFVSLAVDNEALGELPDTPSFVDAEQVDDAWCFAWAAGEASGEAWAMPWGAGWVFSPSYLDPEHIALAEQVLRDMLQADYIDPGYFDAAGLAELAPWHALWPEAEDPTGLSGAFPVALRFHNPFGSDHGLYVGVNPSSGQGRAEAFN